MKFFLNFLLFLSFSCFVQAQKLSLNKRVAISSLNAKAKEAVGNIRVFNSGTKVTVDDASFTATEMGVKIEVSVVNASGTKTIFTSEFNPANITYIKEYELPDKSPVGQMQISLEYKIAYKTTYYKKDGLSRSYEDEVVFNFLKVDEDNFLEIQSALFKLRDLYIEEENEPLKPLSKVMSRTQDFWISSGGASNTYELSKVSVTGCTMRLTYYLQSVSTTGDKKQMYLTVIPLSEIDDVRLDKSKSKPNCIMLESGKRGFETFELKNKIYVPTAAVKELPLFIDVTYDSRRDDVMELLKTQVKECGGGKIKL